MGGTARGSFKIQGQNISKDQSNKSNPQMHILHLSTSFYLHLSACWNLWVTENNSGKQDSLKVGDVFSDKIWQIQIHITSLWVSGWACKRECNCFALYCSYHEANRSPLRTLHYVACLTVNGGKFTNDKTEEEKLILRWVTEREGMYVNEKK